MRPVTWFFLAVALLAVGVIVTPSARERAQNWFASTPAVVVNQDDGAQVCLELSRVSHRAWTQDMDDDQRVAIASDALRHVDDCRDPAMQAYVRGMLLSLRGVYGQKLGRAGWRDDLTNAKEPLAACETLLAHLNDDAAARCAKRREANLNLSG